jgi:hypothetical protein
VAKFDPDGVLMYATYLGGDNIDIGYGITADGDGNAYLTGESGIVSQSQIPFPTTPGAYQTTYSGAVMAFVTKLNSTGSALVYSTLFGGSGIANSGLDIQVDSTGNAYVFGETSSTDLPLQNPAQATYGGGQRDTFVTKLNPNGTGLVYSTYVGGSGWESGGGGIAIDSAGSAYVTRRTTSSDLPVTAGAFDTALSGTSDAFVAKLSPAGDQFDYLTYLGGSDDIGLEGGRDIAVNGAGEAYVTGDTLASDFPTRNPLQATNTGSGLFVTRFNQDGSDILYSTFYGGGLATNAGYGIALDADENMYITGSTSPLDFPTRFAIQPDYGGSGDAFVLKLNPADSKVIYSTYLGGSGGEQGEAIAADLVDGEGRAYIAGRAKDGFPVQNAAQSSFGGGTFDGFVARIDDIFYDVYLPVVIR